MINNDAAPILKDIDYLAPSAPYPSVPSGLTVHQGTIYRYAVPTDEQPSLIITDYIPDYNGNFIPPGIYELALSNDREFLYIIESKDLIAVLPVFKIAENKEELRKYQEKIDAASKENKKELKKKKRQAKLQAIIDKKYAKTGATVPKEYEHTDASIEYIKEGGYYLIMYEKGFIRAWGAIKIKG